jgi:hypothetical protein
MNLKTQHFIENFNFPLFSSFLTKYGWVNDDKYNEIYTTWHRPGDYQSEYELIVPERNNIKYFMNTMENILNELSDYYGKTFSQIIDDFNNSIRDKVKFSVKSEMTKDGLIPITEGIRLLDNTKEMLVSSFLAVKNKKKNYIGHRPDSVNEVLKNIELGQTEEGSFIINIFIPRDYYEGDESTLFQEESFTRKALIILEDASTELLTKAEQYTQSNDITIFDESILKGVSSNLCYAISEISSNGQSDVLIDIEYNNGIDKEIEIRKIAIKRDVIQIINKVAEYFRRDLVEDDFSVYGYVTKLHQEIDEVEGEITLTAIIEGKLRKVKIVLNPEQYLIAQTAHRGKQMIVCKGRLLIQERSTMLLNVSSVLLSEIED